MRDKINELALKHGALSCCKCSRASGVHRITLRKRFKFIPQASRFIKVYVCEECLKKGVDV